MATALSAYFTLNLLIAIAFLGLQGLSKGARVLGLKLKSQSELRLHYLLLAFILSVSVIHPLLPQSDWAYPAAKIWSSPSLQSFSQEYSTANSGHISIAAPHAPAVQTSRLALTWAMLTFAFLIAASSRLIKDLRYLLQLKKNSFAIRKFRSISVLVSETILVPFSYWIPGQTNIVIPATLLADANKFQMALSHEIQHHRHGDTKWIHAFWFLSIVCFLNPFVFLWNRWICEIQEFACDETLVDQNKVESQAYARCLVEVAQTAIDQKYVPVCATGLTFLSERNILKRRIEKMFTPTSTKLGRSIVLPAGLALACILSATAFASKGLVQDRRISFQQALEFAKNTKSHTQFPIVVNDLVVKELNRFLGTPEGREHMRNSLLRMENFRKGIEEKIAEYRVPAELLAVPIVESGYQNLEQRPNAGWGAGLWMFIAQTARAYGLRVNQSVDERLNVDSLTDAAMRYFQSNYLRFKDWHLAALAYNIGESRVQQAIEDTGSRDAWTLIQKGYQNDADYLPKLMAAILIMQNPKSVE